MNAVAFWVWVLEVAALVALVAGFTYPAVAYAQNVLYRDGVLLFAAALACLTVGAVLELVVDATGAGALVAVLAYVWYTASGLLSVAATWQFAREFVDVGDDGSLSVDAGAFSGGFEDER